MERAAAELFLAALHSESTPERQEALRNAAAAARNWEGLPEAIEGHGVLALFLHNVAAAGIELPPALAPLFQARQGAQHDAQQRRRLTLTRFLANAGRAGVELTLVGGSALALELFPQGLRRADELELLVAPEHLARALRAAGEAGLLLSESALPAWWYRRTQGLLALAPSSAQLCGLRLRSTLHHPSLLLGVREPELLARRRRTPFEGHALHQLEDLDAVLEVATRLAAQAGETLLVGGRRNLLVAAGTPDHPLRLARLLDLRTWVERRHADVSVAALVARAREWRCEPALAAALECIQMGLGFQPGAREWVRQVAQALAAARGKGACALFGPDPIERLPQWLRPSDAFLARRYALPSQPAPRALRIARARHLVAVLLAGLVAGVGFPLALLQQRLARGGRRQAWSEAQTPQRLSDVQEAFRSAARVEQLKPLTPRTISLPPQEAGVVRLPDHYKG